MNRNVVPMLRLFANSLIIQLRAAQTLNEWGDRMTHRSGWLVRFDHGERVYVHESGWKVKDFCGPNEGIAVQTVGPDAGKELRNPGGRLFFSAFQAMLAVEKFLREGDQA